MNDGSYDLFAVQVTPSMLTVITTYTCNAACEECCFECNPTVKHRLDLEEISRAIHDAKREFPSIKLVVFTGGECFLLKDELYASIKLATGLGLRTRCVSNGFWGKNPAKADEIARQVVSAGLSEINFSTGLDHQKWVPVDSVINASASLAMLGIPVLITIEKDTAESDCLRRIQDNGIVKKLSRDYPHFSLQTNSWMPFHENSTLRGGVDQEKLRAGCDQVFNNCVVTPRKEVAACCGLTFEHIPEMRIGTLDDISCYRNEQEQDFLKLWLRVEGPMNILESLLGRGHEKLKNIVHLCQACAVLHRDETVREKLQEGYREHLLAVGHKWQLIKAAEQISHETQRPA